MLSSTTAEFKLILVGAENVGKTTYRSRFLPLSPPDSTTSDFTSMLLYSNCGPVNFKIYETSEEDSPIYEDAQCAILMFDVCNRDSYKAIPKFYNAIKLNCKEIPIVLVGNKCDNSEARTVKPKSITFHRKKNLQYYDLSALTNYHVEKPLIYLMRKLVGDPNLCLVEAPALKPTENMMTYDQLKELEDETKNFVLATGEVEKDIEEVKDFED